MKPSEKHYSNGKSNYHPTACAKLLAEVVELTFQDAASDLPRRHRSAISFSHTKMFQMFCDVYEYDVERLQSEIMRLINKTK